MAEIYNQNDEKAIAALLEGRRIVEVETDISFNVDEAYGFATGRLVLDDGTKVYVIPNQGGCACSAGDYELKSLAKVDNVITSVRLENKPGGDCEEGYEGTYRIYVVADAVEINAMQIDGSDGNGYYGTGYELVVRRAEAGGE